jgi:SAM-dependent methyltransferase
MEKKLTNDSIILGQTIKWWLEESDFLGPFEKYIASRIVFNNFIKHKDRVMDLGCANGFLLYSLLQFHPSRFIPFGVDINHKRIAWARRLLPEFSLNLFCQNIFSCEWYHNYFDVVIGPWDQTYGFPSIIKKYKERYPLTKILFYLYDDDYTMFEKMETQIKEFFPKSLKLGEVQVEKLVKLVCIL